jgi:acetoin utilization protein AcuB
MAPQPTIESVMTPYPYSVELDAHAASAKTLMAQFNVRHLPVTQGGAVIGVVSELAIQQAAKLGWDVSLGGSARVGDIFDKSVYTVTTDELLVNVLAAMAEKKFDTTVVLKNNKLAGIFTATDACRRYAELLRTQTK